MAVLALHENRKQARKQRLQAMVPVRFGGVEGGERRAMLDGLNIRTDNPLLAAVGKTLPLTKRTLQLPSCDQGYPASQQSLERIRSNQDLVPYMLPNLPVSLHPVPKARCK